MDYPTGQTAVIVPVPAAEATVNPWRQQFDRPALFGVPAHITILYPFVATNLLTAADVADLVGIFATQRVFGLKLTELREFPKIDGQPAPLYLAPEPTGPFDEVTSQVRLRWPDSPPYEGELPTPFRI